MPREGAIVFGDLIGKLDVLRVTCGQCGRDGCYGLSRLIDKGATTFAPTTSRAAITMRTMDSLRRMAASFSLGRIVRTECAGAM